MMSGSVAGIIKETKTLRKQKLLFCIYIQLKSLNIKRRKRVYTLWHSGKEHLRLIFVSTGFFSLQVIPKME